jgi:hypothetical protein
MLATLALALSALAVALLGAAAANTPSPTNRVTSQACPALRG